MLAYPDTKQFREVIAEITRHTRRLEENRDKPLPVLKFTGTVKLHGTNSAIGYQKDLGHWCQSRNNIITPTKDNASFAQTLHPIADQFFQDHVLPNSAVIRDYYDQGQKIIIYGEWCGRGIQQNVAICGVPKMFVIFKIKIHDKTTTEDEGETDLVQNKSLWLDPKEWSDIKWHEKSIYNIYEFPTYEIEIDFGSPKLSQNKLIEITEAVERQCPVGAYFKQIGIGEGVVWTEWAETRGNLRFKVKGEQHSVSKVKTLAPVDTEKLANLQEFVDYACTENRMNQALDYLREQHLTIEMKNIPVFLKWLIADITKEETDTMEQSNIDPKEMGRAVQSKARVWYQQNIS